MKIYSLWNSFQEGIETDRRTFFFLMLLYASAWNWYFIASKALLPALLVSQSAYLLASFGLDFSIASSMLFGAVLVNGRSRLALLRATTVSAFALTLVFPLVSSPESAILLSFLLGVPVGLASFALALVFSDKTIVRERGRIAGEIMVFSTVTSPLVIISSRMFGLAGGIVWLVVTNLVLVVVSFLLSGSKVKEQKIRRKDLDGIGRSFFMYFLAWALISLYNGFFSPVLDTYAGSFQDLAQLSFILKYVTVGAAALIGGFIMDRHGRKPVLLLGVVLLGLAASLYAVSPSSPTFVLIWAISGGSWGLFLPAFYLLIWAEAAPGEVKAFAYAFGLMVFHLMRSLGFLVYPYLSQFKPIELALISSSVFFLVALSLTFAKETLPLQDRQAIRLSRYMRKAVEEVERA